MQPQLPPGAEYLKKAVCRSVEDAREVHAAVRAMLDEIEAEREAAALRYAARFDRYEGNVVLTPAEIEQAAARVPERLRDDILFARDNVRRFAEAQLRTLSATEVEIVPGFFAGQKVIPCRAAGCYVPGGRYTHIASAIMTVTTARVAGCERVIVCSPPRPGTGIPPAVVYAAHVCGADTILALGGVQGVAAMAFGLFGLPEVDVLVGPGNPYVTEAKRILFGRVGIDMVAGPSEIMILADGTADPELVAADLVGQAEHGPNSPVWLATTDRGLAERVMRRIPELVSDLPEFSRENAAAAWRECGEVILVPDREALAAVADAYAPEHLEVHTADPGWFLERLRCYGSLFLGEETTVAFGDKAAGPNHVLPTGRAARYTGGLSVHKFLKIVTWQRGTPEGIRPIAEATARISRAEGMEAHARTADIRLARYFPGETFDLRAEG